MSEKSDGCQGTMAVTGQNTEGVFSNHHWKAASEVLGAD